jgi:hypothetical protein
VADSEPAPPKSKRRNAQLGNGLPTSEPHWNCHLDYFDIGHEEPCPRCRKPCQWLASVTIHSRGSISQVTLHSPICSCPDDHIVNAIAKILADALVKEYLEQKADILSNDSKETTKAPST